MGEKIKLVIINVVIIATVCGGLYLFAGRTEKNHMAKIEAVNANYRYSRGLIIDMKSYKGHNLAVRYKIGEETLEFKGGWDLNPVR